MLKTAKTCVLSAAKGIGAFSIISQSRWRRQRLLILAYHGVSIDDEHLWDPRLFVSQVRLRERLETLVRLRANVLSLSEALQRQKKRDLPPRAVVLTFDDGNYDFLKSALPVLGEFAFPSTVYLTTYYAGRPWPVFLIACCYLLWKSRNRRLKAGSVPGIDSDHDLSCAEERKHAAQALDRYAAGRRLAGDEKERLLRELAGGLVFDYDEFLAKRILQIMGPEDVRQAHVAGADIQLHTHRHRSPPDRDLFMAEIEDNRSRIAAMTGAAPVHFCYPDGITRPEFGCWLAECGIESATTCVPGLAHLGTNKYFIPRIIDTMQMPAVTFESWVCGFGALVPGRHSWCVRPLLGN